MIEKLEPGAVYPVAGGLELRLVAEGKLRRRGALTPWPGASSEAVSTRVGREGSVMR